MKLIKPFTLSLAALLTLSSCNNTSGSDKVITMETPAFNKEGELSLYKASGKLIRTIDVEVADTAFEQETDLKNRDLLKAHQGMLFIYPEEDLRGYFMKDIRYPLDIIFINAENRIVSFAENTTPLDDSTFLPSQVPAQLVLKINGGLSEEWVIEVGDYVEWKFTN